MLIAAKTGSENEKFDFERIEEKYIVDGNTVNPLRLWIKNEMTPCYPDPKTRYTIIRSTYLDTERLDYYQAHFNKENRFKVRIRQYAPNGVPDRDTFHLEYKEKSDGVTRKIRIAIGHDELEALSHGGKLTVTPHLQAMNLQLSPEKLAKKVKRLGKYLNSKPLHSVATITYRRESFEADGLRLTLDTRIEFQHHSDVPEELAGSIRNSLSWQKALLMRDFYEKKKCVVVEVKHNGQVPQWVQTALSESLAKKASFSKYCYAVTSAIGE